MREKRENEEEIVYKLIAPEKIRFEKPPRYKSKFRNKVEEDVVQSKFSHKTMGYASVPPAVPTGYLHKNTRINPPRPDIEGPRCLAEEKKPNLPPCPNKIRKENFSKGGDEENEKSGKKEEGKDKFTVAARSANFFRVRNIRNVQHAKPPQREPKIADTCKGDRQSLLLSGLAPVYTFKKNYGRPPKYLTQMRKEAEKQSKVQKEEPKVICIEGEERKKLLQDLKHNWNELQTAFQKLPMMIDTIPKIKKKLNLEKELMDLEKDIAIIENHPILYLCDDNEGKSSSFLPKI